MNFGILIFDDVEELDFVGPWEMLTMWGQVAQGPTQCLIVAQSPRPVRCAKGLSVNPHFSFSNCPPLDYLLVPGGQGTRNEVENQVLLDFVSAQAKGCKAVLSVCTGAFILHAAGLLSGRKATTHWGSLKRLRALGDVEVVEDRYMQDGNVWSSAGVSAGIDLMLAFIASVAGDDAAGAVQFAAEYYPSAVRYGSAERHEQAPAYLKANSESDASRRPCPKAEQDVQFFVYVYRDAEGNPVYVGQGMNIERAVSHQAGASNQRFRAWLEQNERQAQVEVVGPLGSQKMADAVETALISMCKSAAVLKDRLFNDHPGISAYRFRPLGVPFALAARTTQPVGAEELVQLVQEHGPLLFVRVTAKPIINAAGEVVPGYDLANPPTDAQILHRMREAWQVDPYIAGWMTEPSSSPALLVGVTGGPGMQTIIGCASIDRAGWNDAEHVANNLVIVPLVDSSIDAAQLRGRPILRDVGLAFNAFRHSQFFVFGLEGLGG